MTALGFKSPKQLNDARRKAIDAGWLVYERKNDRCEPDYWTLIPDGLVLDPVDIHSANGKHSENGKHIHSASGTGNGTGNGKPPSLRNPRNPPSCPGSESPDGQRTKPTQADLETASWFWGLIQELEPDQKPPKLDRWANDIRLMRTQDGRTNDEIRAVFAKANADTFWRGNILCPAKFREKYSVLKIKFFPKQSNGHTNGMLTVT